VSGTTGEREPVLRVISGEATDEEIAALVAVVMARPGGGGEVESAPTSTWADQGSRHRGVRPVFSLLTPFTPGPDAWRTSHWPR
jgi:hypothetical protein